MTAEGKQRAVDALKQYRTPSTDPDPDSAAGKLRQQVREARAAEAAATTKESK